MSRKRGRPKIPIDLRLVETLSGMQCTEEEIAGALDVSPETLRRRKNKEPEIQDAIDRGRAKGRASLRRSQWRIAESGNPTMLIWLGKQYLNQTDSPVTVAEPDIDRYMNALRKSARDAWADEGDDDAEA